MSTALANRPAHRAPSPTGSEFTGTTHLLRLYVRRDRLVAPLWILLLSVPLASVYVGSVDAVYPTAADRAAFAASIMASPAQRALYGSIYNDSLGAVGIWKAGIFHLLIAVAVIMTVIRHTRADEEVGRTELLDSTVVGRRAGLAAAVLLAFGAAILTGLIGVAGLLMTDIPVAGSLAFSAALTASGLVFAAVAAVAAQLSPSARTARGIAFSVLAAAFTVRAVGDAGAGALSWLSPLGWSLQVRPFAGDHWWVLALHLVTIAALTVAAFLLLGRRDVGSGLLAQRPGPAAAAPRLRGTGGLAWRLDRGAVLLWTVGLALYGLLIGSVVHGVGDEIGNSDLARDMVTRLGGTSAMEQAFLAVAFTMLAMVASAFVVSLVLRLHQEESAQRLETLLAGSVSRTRWLTSHVAVAILGSAGAMAVAGMAAGLAYGAAAGDVATMLPTVVGTALVQLPAVWLPGAVALVLFGALPRFTPAAWGVVVGLIAVYLLGSLSGAPQWLLDLQPYSHIPHVGTGTFSATALVWLVVLDAALAVAGIIAFRRRDLR
jgi:ABC-2 type transport system permease protein